MSGNLSDNRTLIVGEDSNNSMVGSTGKSTEISTRGSSTSVGREGVSTCNGTSSAITFDSGSSRTSGSTVIEDTKSVSTFTMKGSVIVGSQAQTLAQYWTLCNLVHMNK